MATFTYDPTEYQEGELSQEEQDSYNVGEQLYQEEQNLLAGKFRDAEDLENAYLELQRKLGERNSEPEPEQQQYEQETAPTEIDPSFLDDLWNDSLSEYRDETLQKLEQLSAAEVAQMYLDYRAQAEQNSPQGQDLTRDDIDQLQGVVGGQENYNQMIAWAADNISEQEQEMFDTVIDRGDPLACFFAVQALANRYNEAIGYEGQMLQGYAPRNDADVFRSQAEVVRAMNDPRYEDDPAYRQDVFDKLERSNLDYYS
jgi:hypothetical protein